jgi:hypothetical protein
MISNENLLSDHQCLIQEYLLANTKEKTNLGDTLLQGK